MQQKFINGFKINPIGIGTWMIGGGWYGTANVPFSDYSNDINDFASLKYAISKGLNHIDSAELYGAGHTEELVGEAINSFDRSTLCLSSKISRSNALRKSIVPATKNILRRMQTDYLDMLYIHAPFPEVSMQEYIYGLNDAVEAGLVKNIAVSNFNLMQLREAIAMSKYPIAANQLRYNILYKKEADKDMLEFCRSENITIVAYRPIERKLLADNTSNDELLAIAEKYKKTPAQIALNWLIMQENVVAIPKATKKEHMDENLGALEFELESGDWQKLNMIESIN